MKGVVFITADFFFCLCFPAAAVTRMVVMEGQDVLLSCSIGSSTNIQLELFDWKKDSQKEVFMYDRGSHYNKDRSDQDPQFKGRVFHFPEELQHGNASVLLRHSQVEDSGNYTCDFPFHQPSRRADVQLIVGESSHQVFLSPRGGMIENNWVKPTSICCCLRSQM